MEVSIFDSHLEYELWSGRPSAPSFGRVRDVSGMILVFAHPFKIPCTRVTILMDLFFFYMLSYALSLFRELFMMVKEMNRAQRLIAKYEPIISLQMTRNHHKYAWYLLMTFESYLWWSENESCLAPYCQMWTHYFSSSYEKSSQVCMTRTHDVPNTSLFLLVLSIHISFRKNLLSFSRLKLFFWFFFSSFIIFDVL